MNNMSNIFSNDTLTKINAVGVASDDARVDVLDTFIGLGKKFDAMDAYGLSVASSNEVMQHFIENRDAICEQFYQESAKGRNKFMTSVFYGSLGGATLGSLLAAAPAVALLQFGFVGGIAGGALLSAGAILGGFGGTVIGVKISDKIRRDKARKEVLGDINDLISEIIKANTIDDGSDDIVFSKGVHRALDILFESTNMILRNESSGKLNPAMSKKEKDACMSLTTALTNFATKKDSKSAKILFKVINTAVEEILKSLGADVTEAEKEIKDRLKKAGKSNSAIQEGYDDYFATYHGSRYSGSGDKDAGDGLMVKTKTASISSKGKETSSKPLGRTAGLKSAIKMKEDRLTKLEDELKRAEAGEKDLLHPAQLRSHIKTTKEQIEKHKAELARLEGND